MGNESNFLKSIEGHAPGPFVVQPEGKNQLHIEGRGIFTVIASLFSDPMDEETKANAALLKKSYLLPDIYKLLEEVKSDYETNWDYDDKESGSYKKAQQAKQLLDKLNS